MNEGLPQVEVIIDRTRAYNLGLSVASVAREIAAAMNGATATTFRFEGNEYKVVLELREEDREKLPDLGKVFVQANTGLLIPLANFATLEKGVGPVSINRFNQSRVIKITGTLTGGASAFEAEQKIRNILSEQYILPDGVSISYDGQAEQMRDMLKTFVVIIILAILLVFGCMAGQYESFKNPFINMFTMPFVSIGIVAVYLITGQPISMFTMVGLVMLMGIVTNNGIILVDYTKMLVDRGTPVGEACIEAGEARLRPVLMTTLTTVLGLVPMAFFPGKSATMIQPIGLTVIGGLLSSTLITLIFIPVLYSLFNEKREKLSKQENTVQNNLAVEGA
jgi:HAE1 family hydrophobic/amphiphilic exporter-1